MVVTTVRPPLARRLIVFRILWAVVESKPEVGSSSNKRLGLMSISWPMLTLFFSPPDIPLKSGPPIMLPLQRVSPSSVITRSTCSTFSSLVKLFGSLRSAVNTRVSKTVRWGYRTSSWATKPVLLFMAPEKGWLLYVIFPDNLPLRRPPRAVRSVVLPLPDGPNIASISPGQTIPVIPFNMVFSLELHELPQQSPFCSSLTLYTSSSNCKMSTEHRPKESAQLYYIKKPM